MSLENRCALATLVGFLYFLLVFSFGFVFGLIRQLWLVPMWGDRWAELAEMPLMILVITWVARRLVNKFSDRLSSAGFLVVGVVALVCLLLVELTLVGVFWGISIPDYILSRDSISGAAYLLSLELFAAIPAWLSYRLQRNR